MKHSLKWYMASFMCKWLAKHKISVLINFVLNNMDNEVIITAKYNPGMVFSCDFCGIIADWQQDKVKIYPCTLGYSVESKGVSDVVE